MLQNDLILDFNLYLCEKFGYRNSCSVMQNANGFAWTSVSVIWTATYASGSIAKEEATFPTGASSLCVVTSRRTKPKASKT